MLFGFLLFELPVIIVVVVVFHLWCFSLGVFIQYYKLCFYARDSQFANISLLLASSATCLTVVDVVDHFYIALFSNLKQTRSTLVTFDS